MAERILVTGGAGCIGSDLAAVLLARGAEVTVLDNLSSGRPEHVEPLRYNSRFHFVEGDLLDRGTLDSVMKQIDTVYHLAANPDVKYSFGDKTDKDLRQNLVCTYNVLESMRVFGVRRLAFSSSSAVYGISERQPIPEDGRTRPISLYGATKLGCEALIGAFQHLFRLDCWIFRFANIVGAKVRKKGRTVIADFVTALREDPTVLHILGDGRQAKSYLMSDECVEAMLYVVGHAPRGLNVFNVGCSDSLEVRDIGEMVVHALGLCGVRFEYTGGEGGWLGDVPRFTLDVSAINDLGWRARRTSAEAVRLAISRTLEGQESLGTCRS